MTDVISNDSLNELGIEDQNIKPTETVAGTETKTEPEINKEYLESLKKTEIISLASDKKIKIDQSLSKADLIISILNSFNLKPEVKPEGKPVSSHSRKKAYSGISLIDGKVYTR